MKLTKVKVADDANSVERNVNLLKNAKEGDFAKGTYCKLIADTFQHRRQFIEQKATSTKQIIMEYPFMTQPEHVSKLNPILQCLWHHLKQEKLFRFFTMGQVILTALCSPLLL